MNIPIRPMIDCGSAHDAQAFDILTNQGPAGVVKHYAVAARLCGFLEPPIVRMIPDIDWARIDKWLAAFNDSGIGWSIYCNPANLNAIDVADLCTSGPRFICEGVGVGADGWVLGAIKSCGLLDATEPGIDRGSPVYARDVPAVITDYEWNFGKEQPGGWHSFQIPPWEGAGCWRWYQPASDPHATRETVLVNVWAWLAGLDPSFVKVAVVPADLAATYSIRVDEITGA